MRRRELGLLIGVVAIPLAVRAQQPDRMRRIGRAHGRNCRRYGELSAVNTREQWQLTRDAAELYERYPARYILGPWAPLLVDAARLEAGERVLDVACGTGVVTRAAAERVGPTGRIVGVDLNPGMIAVARSLPAPIGASIEWLERSALDLRLEDASFDVVLCQQGLQFFPDKAVALQEMRRVLDRGGRLALSVWHSTGLYNSAVGEALARFVGNETAVRFSSSRQAPTAEELQRLAMEASFSDIEVRISRINVHLPRLDKFTLDHLAATPVAPVIAAADPEARKKIGASVMKQLQRYADGDGVTYPEETLVLTAQVR
jgi:ubiquinone/menaquinone biosynthesis C-methylase UbiE